jgi:hypothetical protein
MVHVTLADSSSSATLPTGSVAGPLSFWADSVTVSGTEYASGMLLVVGGTVHQTAKASPAHVLAWPYALVGVMAFAFLCSRLK